MYNDLVDVKKDQMNLNTQYTRKLIREAEVHRELFEFHKETDSLVQAVETTKIIENKRQETRINMAIATQLILSITYFRDITRLCHERRLSPGIVKPSQLTYKAI